MRIFQLPPAIANQIAAGEVIERPASVVKELLENSLDAGATSISIDVSYGGLNQIKISDNGSGIVAEDLPLAVAAHATSKITSLTDLYAISSMGFRGEALASIASVAKVSISSKPEQQEHAMMLRVKGEEQTIIPCARAVGTTIDVCDLFFNVPVRKRFLKSERLEFQAIEGVVKRFALSAPHIALSLTHNNKMIVTLPAALNELAKQQRMSKILGSNFVKNALFLDVEHGAMRLHGWVSGVNDQRSQSDRQWVYINHRMVKDKLIHHALKQAYDGLLHPGRFPSCLLYFTINTEEVDVNVHPTKHEVRFQQPRLVHDFFVAQLTKALQVEEQSRSVVPSNIGISNPSVSWAKTELRELHSNYNLVRNVAPVHSLQAKNSMVEDIPWTALNKHYSLLWIKQEPYLVDIARLYHSWLQQKISQDIPLASRPLLVTVRYSLTQPIVEFNELQSLLLSLGLSVEQQKEELVIRTIPIALPYLDLKLFFDGVLSLTHYSLSVIEHYLIQAQIIDSRQLTPEERMELSQYLIYIQESTSSQNMAYKHFTADDCRMLLNV